ncbi:MAG: hypothetical protein IT361_03025 [Gemmatimonadaceae bacterium]|nr:hypothetical protein [Gemmatimonadaceae bacterium]
MTMQCDAVFSVRHRFTEKYGMGWRFWFTRFATAFVAALVVLTVVRVARGSSFIDAATYGALWGAVFAALFTVIGYLRFRRNPACMLPPPPRSNDA